jgi:sugar phosphate isomerase/epimerase
LDENLRRKGVEAVKRSVDFASQNGISTVVVHPGVVLMDVELEKQLRSLIQLGKQDTDEYRTIMRQMREKRAEMAPAALESVKKSIVELADTAKMNNVRLGLENRNHFREIPSPDEMEILLGLDDPSCLGVTFDIGHAMHLARLGFYSFDEWLKRFSERIFETHIHDIRGVIDHFAAGLGEVDFDLVSSYLPENAIRTCEFLDTNSPEEVLAALAYLFEHNCIRSIKEG